MSLEFPSGAAFANTLALAMATSVAEIKHLVLCRALESSPVHPCWAHAAAIEVARSRCAQPLSAAYSKLRNRCSGAGVREKWVEEDKAAMVT